MPIYITPLNRSASLPLNIRFNFTITNIGIKHKNTYRKEKLKKNKTTDYFINQWFY